MNYTPGHDNGANPALNPRQVRALQSAGRVLAVAGSVLLICVAAQFPDSALGQVANGKQWKEVPPAVLCADFSLQPTQRIASCTEALRQVLEDLGRAPSRSAKVEQAKLLDERATALTALGKRDEAIADYSKAIELNRGDLVAFASRSNLILDKNPGQIILIEPDLDEQVRKAWTNGIDFYDKGVKFESRGEFDNAINAFRSAVHLLPSFARAHSDLGRLLKAKDAEEAMVELSEAIFLDPWIPGAPAYIARADLNLSLGRLEPALEDLNEIIARDSTNSIAYLNRGVIKEKQGSLEGAVEDYSHSIYLRPSADAHFNRANAYNQLVEPDKALDDFNAALALDAKNLRALIGKADLDYSSGRLADSRDDYTLLVAAQPKNADFVFKRGNVYFDMGNFDAAFRDYSLSLAIDPNQPDVLRNRALASEHLGASKDAERDRRRASAGGR
jgi:tetratricopeptide (TPR) repeat protein